MLVIPAVDIMDGKCVRLLKGDPKKKKIYYDDPLEAAQLLENKGAELIHIIDLDAAMGSGQNMKVIKRILKNTSVKLQIGGGVRTLQKVNKLLKFGAYRIIFGTSAVKNPSLIKESVRLHGSKSITIAIDEKNDEVAIHGWKTNSGLDYLNFARSIQNMGVGSIIFTSISADGTLLGPQIEKTRKLVETIQIPVIASGGVSKLEDLIALKRIGASGVVVGTAIYEKRFTFKEALETIDNVG